MDDRERAEVGGSPGGYAWPVSSASLKQGKEHHSGAGRIRACAQLSDDPADAVLRTSSPTPSTQAPEVLGYASLSCASAAYGNASIMAGI